MSKNRKRDEEVRPDRHQSEEERPDRHRSEKERDYQISQQSELIRKLVAEIAEKSSENRIKKMLLEKTKNELIDAERIIDGTKEELDKAKEALTKQTEGIKNSLMCKICEEHCMPPLKACACGVVVCDYCISKGPTTKCFFCNKVAARTRNLKLETLAAELEFACPGCGPDRTCGDKFLYKDATKHTNVCPRTFLLLCPIDGCYESAGFKTEDIKKHFLTKHGIEANKCLGLPPNKIWQPYENLTIDIKNSPQLSGQTDTHNYLIETTQGIVLMIHCMSDDLFSSTIYHFPDPAFENQARFSHTMNSHCENSEDVSSVTIMKFTEMPRWNGFLCDKSQTEIKAIKQVGMSILELDRKRITKFSHKGILKLKITLEFKETNDIQNQDDVSLGMSSPKSPEYNDIFAIIANSTPIPDLEESSDSEGT